MRSRTWLALPLYFFGSWAFAQQASRPDLSLIDLDSLLKAHAHQLRSAESRFNENGFAFLLHEIGDAQVVAIAEEHNTAEIPQFAAMLFERLHRSLGFDYFADEQNPYALQLLSSPARRASPDSIAALARRWPTQNAGGEPHGGMHSIDVELAARQHRCRLRVCQAGNRE